MPMLRRMNLPSNVSPTRTLMISPLPENVAMGLLAGPNVPMYLYVNGGGVGGGGGGGGGGMGRGFWQSSPTPLWSTSTWLGLGTSGQLSWKSGMPSLSRSGGGLGAGGGGGGGGSLYANRLRLLLYVPLGMSSHSMCTAPTPRGAVARAVRCGARTSRADAGASLRPVAAKV